MGRRLRLPLYVEYKLRCTTAYYFSLNNTLAFKLRTARVTAGESGLAMPLIVTT